MNTATNALDDVTIEISLGEDTSNLMKNEKSEVQIGCCSVCCTGFLMMFCLEPTMMRNICALLCLGFCFFMGLIFTIVGGSLINEIRSVDQQLSGSILLPIGIIILITSLLIGMIWGMVKYYRLIGTY